MEHIPIFLEKKNGRVSGSWMHDDARISTKILLLAYTSDLGILRIIASNLNGAAVLLKKRGVIVRQTADAVEIAPDGSCGLLNILIALAENGIDTELTGIIPGMYQG
jgi:hypothetical protein